MRVVAVLGIVAALALVLLLRGRTSDEAASRPTAVAAPAAIAPHAAPSTAAPGAAAPAPVNAYFERQEFQRRTREFFAHAADLPQAQRERDARAVEAGIDRYERAGELSAGEAVLLRASLIRATAADGPAQTERIAELAARYQVNAEVAMAAWAQRHDPQFDEYKKRERAIVEEVMALKTIPGGMERDAYLRERLQAERERVYAADGAP